ncbi:L,D-transpeptidase family protein [Methyloligella solikamskensis]|uniref:L,D-transpeptidase family protein n=1 Tax=Methyloligella solikamskensis TaxID=1177756 RepID=A0ABW3J5L4_9HYPH
MTIETAIRAVRDGGYRSFPAIASAGILAAAISLAPVNGPAFAADKNKDAEATDPVTQAAASDEPMTLIVALDAQKVDIYRGTKLITSSSVSTGMRGHTTKSGVFSVLEKKRRHYSNLYNGAPMPWMQRLTWSGTALHAGALPGYPASHGCIRLPYNFAPKLFEMTGVGENVVVSRNRPEPRIIEHAKLFQPLPMPTPPVVSKADRTKQKASAEQGESQSFADAASPVILANAEMSSDDAAAKSDADEHAIDPYDIASTDDAGSDMVDRGTDHAIDVDRPLSLAAKKLNAGGLDAAAAAAEPRNEAPLRILITKATKRDRIRGVQFQLADLGYLTPQMFDGTFGSLTIDAIKDFQRDHDMPPSGAVTDDVVKAIYEANGKDMPPNGHLFVRREFDRVYDVPAAISMPNQDLGTHVFTAMNFSSGDTKARWMAISTNDGDPYAALDRVEIPEEARQWISERLTPGSSLIIGDTAINTAALPEGADYVVLAEDPGKPAARPVSTYSRPQQPRVEQRRYYYEPRRRERRRTGGPFWFRY